MTCPRCGTVTDSWPCPGCGFPEVMYKVDNRFQKKQVSSSSYYLTLSYPL